MINITVSCIIVLLEETAKKIINEKNSNSQKNKPHIKNPNKKIRYSIEKINY
jgi:hypothetical protein